MNQNPYSVPEQDQPPADTPRKFAGRGVSFWFWVAIHIGWIVAVLVKFGLGQSFFY